MDDGHDQYSTYLEPEHLRQTLTKPCANCGITSIGSNLASFGNSSRYLLPSPGAVLLQEEVKCAAGTAPYCSTDCPYGELLCCFVAAGTESLAIWAHGRETMNAVTALKYTVKTLEAVMDRTQETLAH